MNISSKNKEHWESFYSNDQNLSYPSQFAAFVATVLKESDFLIDLGCGNGRDTVFLLEYVKKIAGVDKCNVATEKLNEKLKNTNGCAYTHSFGDDANQILLEKLGLGSVAMRVVFYSRFFFHSIDDNAQNSVFDFLCCSAKPGDLFCFEFRTSGDEFRDKIYMDHERRYINFNSFLDILSGKGFRVMYSLESTGLAFYRGEDPVVGRGLAIFGENN